MYACMHKYIHACTYRCANTHRCARMYTLSTHTDEKSFSIQYGDNRKEKLLFLFEIVACKLGQNFVLNHQNPKIIFLYKYVIISPSVSGYWTKTTKVTLPLMT